MTKKAAAVNKEAEDKAAEKAEAKAKAKAKAAGPEDPSPKAASVSSSGAGPGAAKAKAEAKGSGVLVSATSGDDASGAKDQGPGLEQLLPASKRPRVADAPEEIAKPQLPDEDAPDAGSRVVMKAIIPWVLQELPKAMMRLLKEADTTEMCEREPLAIDSEEFEGLTSFKEKWNPASCLKACEDSGMYEAAANATWVDPEVNSTTTALPSEDPPWSWVESRAKPLFAVSVNRNRERIVFPTPLKCYRRGGLSGLDQVAYPKGGLVLLSGHAFLYCWYLSVYYALGDGADDGNLDAKRLKLLYESALTVTIHMFVTEKMELLALEANRVSEFLRSSQRVSVNSFLTFAQNVALIGGPKPDLKKLMKLDVQYNGGQINLAMMKVIAQLKTIESAEVLRLFRLLDREFGHEVLTGSYNKLKLFCAAAKNSENAAWILKSQLVALRRKEVTTANFALNAYQKEKTSEEANFMSVAMATRSLIKHLETVLEGVKAVDATLGEKMIAVHEKLESPLLWHETFPPDDSEEDVDNMSVQDEQSGGDEGGQSSGVLGKKPSAASDYIEALKATSPKGVVLFAQLHKNIYFGEYSDAQQTIANSKDVPDLLHKMSEDELGAFAKDMKECMKCLCAAEAVVSAKTGGSSAPPAPSLRELTRQASDGHDPDAAKNERTEVWKRTVTQRKKCVTLLNLRNPRAKASYVAAGNKFPAFKNFEGQAGKEHRVFVVSADLQSQDKSKAPWLEGSVPDDKVLAEMLGYLESEARGSVDVIVAWDGGMRAARRQLEDTLADMSGTSEVFIVYKTAWNHWIKRKQFLNSDTREVGYITLPRGLGRNKYAVTGRDEGCSAIGEETSHYTTYSGVVPPARLALPRVSDDDKATIWPSMDRTVPEKWRKTVSSGVPMFWNETKPVSFWVSLLGDVKAGCVIDLTPGSGALASACMSAGIQYLGFTAHPAHHTWLTNVIDREALKYICQGGNYLYQEDLAKVIEELFADVVESEEVHDEEIMLSDAEEP